MLLTKDCDVTKYFSVQKVHFGTKSTFQYKKFYSCQFLYAFIFDGQQWQTASTCDNKNWRQSVQILIWYIPECTLVKCLRCLKVVLRSGFEFLHKWIKAFVTFLFSLVLAHFWFLHGLCDKNYFSPRGILLFLKVW